MFFYYYVLQLYSRNALLITPLLFIFYTLCVCVCVVICHSVEHLFCTNYWLDFGILELLQSFNGVRQILKFK